jgi:hypothetical protein
MARAQRRRTIDLFVTAYHGFFGQERGTLAVQVALDIRS